MTAWAAELRAKTRDEVLSQVAADHVRLIAQNVWLATVLEWALPSHCLASLGYLECAKVTASGDVIGDCVVTAAGSEARVRECWLRAAAQATTKPKEVTT